jgi:hypothetical protein
MENGLRLKERRFEIDVYWVGGCKPPLLEKQICSPGQG